MNSKRVFYGLIFAIVVMVAATLGSAYLANQQLQKQSAKLADYKLKNQVLAQEEVGLQKAKKDLAKYSPLEQTAKTIVPQDKDQAEAVREIVKIAADNGIQPSSITFPASTLGSNIGAASSSTATSTPSTSTSTSSAAAANSKTALSQLIPVKGLNGVYDLQITIQQDVSSAVPYSKFIGFLSGLEQNRRTAQVTSIILQPSSVDHTQVSFTLTVDEYIKP